jgi:putative peptide zinc metalloprotease protein
VSRPIRWIALAALLLACALPGGAQAAASTQNVATATTEQDDSRVFDLAWDVDKQRGGVVDHFNSAEAAARCVRCRATAIAFQIVIVSGAPQTAAPINQAVALNHECTECVVVAEARQFVRVVDQPAKLTGAGRTVLADVQRDLLALQAQDPPLDQLHQAVEQQEARVRHVLNTELVLKADRGEEPEVLDGLVAQESSLD